VTATVDHLCASIAQGGPVAVAATKRMLHSAMIDGDRRADAFRAMRQLSDQHFQSAEAAEGMAAFAAKRPPAWAPEPAP
jgi:methylglutaconyl-CoA hydratase